DFDDAVLVEARGTGFRLTVAVADVAHYVPAGSPLDLEARARGTSVYFPDRVLPMLPEELSNGICSLKPDEDRLAKAVRMEFDARGRETGVSFHDAVMRSAARLTYTQVSQALVDRDPAARAALGTLVEPLERAEALARLLMPRRRQRGAIDFDPPAAEVGLALRRGAPRPLRPRPRVLHALHLAHPPLPRPGRAPHPRDGARAARARRDRRGVLAARAHGDGRRAGDRGAEEGPVHAGQGGRGLRRLRLGRRAVRLLRRARGRVRRGPRAREHARRRLLRSRRAPAPAARPARAADLPRRRSGPRGGRRGLDRTPAG